MRIRSIIASAAIIGTIVTSRPYSITRINNVTARFDNGECGYVYTGLPHTGSIESFWRPDPLNGVFTWGFTQDGIEYDFIPSPC